MNRRGGMLHVLHPTRVRVTMNRGGAENAEKDAEMTISRPRW